MTYRNESRRPKRVNEPVQVYLDGPQLNRLRNLAELLVMSKSDVIRLSLESLERQLSLRLLRGHSD